jgi:hypothetical protein
MRIIVMILVRESHNSSSRNLYWYSSPLTPQRRLYVSYIAGLRVNDPSRSDSTCCDLCVFVCVFVCVCVKECMCIGREGEKTRECMDGRKIANSYYEQLCLLSLTCWQTQTLSTDTETVSVSAQTLFTDTDTDAVSVFASVSVSVNMTHTHTCVCARAYIHACMPLLSH